jgi:hypothetical protein
MQMWLIFVGWEQLAQVAVVVAPVVVVVVLVVVVVTLVGAEAVVDELATVEIHNLLPVKMAPLEQKNSHFQNRLPGPLLHLRNRRNR